MNTVFIQPEHLGTWRNILGYILLVLAIVDRFNRLTTRFYFFEGQLKDKSLSRHVFAGQAAVQRSATTQRKIYFLSTKNCGNEKNEF
jgi:hypothetical protein